MINKILVPLDGSDEAEVILPYVSRLAVGLDVPVVLLAVLDQESMGMRQSFFSRLYERAEAGARDRLHDVAQTLGKEGVNAIEVIASGKSAPEIVKAAGHYKCGLIAMATHGRNMLARGILGSVTDQVMHSSDVAVLAITQNKAAVYRGGEATLTRVMVPLDGSPLAESALPYVEDLARELSLEVLLVRAVQPVHLFWMDHLPAELIEEQGAVEAEAEKYLAGVATRLAENGHSVTWRLLIGHPATSIVELARETPHDIIAMASRGQSGFTRLAMGSVAEALIRGTGDPVFVVHPSESSRPEP